MTRMILVVAVIAAVLAIEPCAWAQSTEMTQYYMVFLRRGPAWTSKVTPETKQVSDGHMANIQRLAKEGRMVVAGPFDGQSGNRALAGIFILRAANMDEAKAITDTDPAVKAGRFVYEIAPWWGPSTLSYSSTDAAEARTACNRACLTGFVDTYFKALTANTPATVPLSPNARVTMNGKVMKLGDAFWDSAERTVYRFDIVNERLGDTGTEAVVQNADGSKTMYMVRLKVTNGQITEVETIKANKGEADRLWDPDNLKEVSPALQLSMRDADRDSYYALIAAAESYWRAFQTNGTEDYHPANLLPDARRFENGVQTTGMVRDGRFVSAAEGFDKGRFIGRNLWDRRYPVVDEERGIVLSIVRFGLKDGAKSQSAATTNDRLVAEFFAVKHGMIQEVHAVLFNLPDAQPTGWEPMYGPGRGGH